MTAGQPQHDPGEASLEHVEALRAEIHRAMAAVSGNALEAFEESLWRQEVLCVGLKHLLGAAHERDRSLTLQTRLRASMTALHQLNQSYAELLQQAQASNHLLYALCRSYGAHSREPAPFTGTRCSLEA